MLALCFTAHLLCFFCSNFTPTETASSQFNFTVSLFRNSDFNETLNPTGPGFSVTDRVYVELNSGNNFTLKPLRCVSSLTTTFGDASERTLITNACAVGANVTRIQYQSPAFRFSFLPARSAGTANSNQIKYVICEAEVCDPIAVSTCNDDCTVTPGRRRRALFPGRMIRSSVMQVSSPFKVQAYHGYDGSKGDRESLHDEISTSDENPVHNGFLAQDDQSFLPAHRPSETFQAATENNPALPRTSATTLTASAATDSSLISGGTSKATEEQAIKERPPLIKAPPAENLQSYLEKQQKFQQPPILRPLPEDDEFTDKTKTKSLSNIQKNARHKDLEKIMYILGIVLVAVVILLGLVLMFMKCHSGNVAKVDDTELEKN